MSKNPLDQKVRAWLEKQGYPLEMRVAGALQQENLATRQSWYYEDPENRTPREIDIIASRFDDIGLGEVQFAIECKHSSHPWILFTSDYTAANFNRVTSFCILSENARMNLRERLFPFLGTDSGRWNEAQRQGRAERRMLPWFEKSDRTGYSLCRALSDRADVTYTACLSAMKAAAWLRTNSVQRNWTEGDFNAVFPVVVTSAPLYECYLDPSGEVGLEPIDAGFLFFPRETEGVRPLYLRIVSEVGLQQFVIDADAIATRLIYFWEKDIEAEYERRSQMPAPRDSPESQ